MIDNSSLMRRRFALIKEEPLFRQQSPKLQEIGNLWAYQESDITIKSCLRNIDLTVWDESENLLHNFTKDLEFAPYFVQSFLSEIADKGSKINLEIQLPSMVAALTIVRICAGGKEVREKHKALLGAIIDTQQLPTKKYDYFNDWCNFFAQNKLDPTTGEETLYRRGDPMERAKDTEEAKAEARIDTLLGQILDATEGWNTKDTFGDFWNQWKELWLHLLKQEEIVEKIAQKCPNRYENATDINIRLVCNVAGLMKRHLEKIHKQTSMTERNFADHIKKFWKADSRRKEISKTTEIEEQANQIKDWLAKNIK